MVLSQRYDILLYTLPFHGRRKAPTEPFGGYGYFAHGILHINEAVAQSVYDFRLFMDYLESTGCRKNRCDWDFFRRLHQCAFSRR